MIGIKLSGRLGNQLFQYAFAYSIAKREKTTFFFDGSTQEYLVSSYFQAPIPWWNKIIVRFKNIPRIVNIIARICKTVFQEITLDDSSGPEIEILKGKNWAIISGYFQSFYYFEQEVIAIRKLFLIREKYAINPSDYFIKDRASVVVHIRRGDYLTTSLEQNNAKVIAIDKGYFIKAIRHIKSIISEKYKIYIVSDDIKRVKEEFLELDDDFIYLSNSTIVDFQLIQHADYLILSNSSFSWWGGFLNTKAKRIIAPKYWCGFEHQKFFPHSIDYKLHWHWI